MRDRPLLWGGLRWRLTAWVAVVMLLFAAVIFVAVYRGTATQLRHQIDRALAGDAGEFSHNLKLQDEDSPHALAAAATRYVNDQPFGASSTLLFAIIPGAGTSTNQPELLGNAAPDNDESTAEQDQENHLAQRVLSVHDGYSTVDFPDVGDLRLLKRRVSIDSRLRVTIGVGEPLAAVHEAQHGIAQAFILAGALALAAALLASYLVGARVSLPLRRMAAIAARVDAGELEPRIHETGGPGDEVRVLADAFNHMLDRLSAAFAGQRAFVADASHELRTPLTVIRGQLEVLSAQSDPPIEEVRRVERLVQAEVSRITRLVDDLLLLAKSEETQFLHVQAIDLRPYIEDLWDGMSLTADRRFELSIDPRRHAPGRPRPARPGPAQPRPQRDRAHLGAATGLSGWTSRRSRATGCASSSPTTARAFPPTSASWSSTASTAPMRPATAPRAEPGSGSRSSARSRSPMPGASSVGEQPGGGAKIELELPGFTASRSHEQNAELTEPPAR